MRRLLDIMGQLRDPDKGCPWDLRQTYSTIVPYTLEEAYEVADTIQRGEMGELRDELGDLLFQVVFYCQIAQEEDQSDEQLRQAWEQQKAKERAKQKQSAPSSQMDGIAQALPALIRAEKLQKRAARVGFDWPDAQGALDKVQEEFDEVRQELENFDRQHLQDELGDLMFAMVNVVRLLSMDAEQTLTQANRKFERRFRALEEQLLQQGITDLQTQNLELLDAVWEQVKKVEKND
ncbi:MAG: nucleoside triphosphate pyrophosphohydrolase [Candidatus Thiodiazotropha sp.]